MRKFTILAITLFIATAAQAQTGAEADVAKAVETLKQAMIDGNRKALEDIAAKELSYGHSSGLIEDKAAFVEAIASGKSDFVTITLSEQTVSVIGNTALVRHKLVADTNNAGTPGKANLSVLLVWSKVGNQWKLLARQATKI